MKFLLVVLFFSNDFNMSLLGVSILPLVLSYGVGIEVLKIQKYDSNYLSFLLKRIVQFTFFVSLAHIISSIASYGVISAFVKRGEDSFFGLFSVYQKVIYFPTVLSCVFIFSLYTNVKFKKIINTSLSFVR